jgi:L-lactate dehydrogenase complex protein LldG
VSDARTAILARLRSAQRTAHLPAVQDSPRSIGQESHSPAECLARFRQELTLLGVDNHLEADEDAVRGRVAALVEGQRVLSWDAAELPYALGDVLPADACFGRSPRDEQARADIGLTGCEGAIAETGSLAVLARKGRSRAISLLPAVHLAVVARSEICWSMGEYFRTRGERMAQGAACVFITGPSRTADIELTLTLGVHGPGRVIVVIGP